MSVDCCDNSGEEKADWTKVVLEVKRVKTMDLREI